MRKSLRLVAVVLLGGSAVAGQSALAQEAVSSTVDGTTISVGGGIQFLWLPDMKFTGAGKPSNFHFQTNSEFTAYGQRPTPRSRRSSAIGAATV
jgi:hypothetical protein